MKLKCQCCGIEQEFANGEEAFHAGWDAPPHFTGYVTCKLCPAVCIVLGIPHTKAHANWEQLGRPDNFSVERCGTDDNFGDAKLGKELQDMADKITGVIVQETSKGETRH